MERKLLTICDYDMDGLLQHANFKRVNPHPQGKRVKDCVKRACVLASGINYHDIAIMLNRFRAETGARKFNTDDNWRQFIIKVLMGCDLGNMQYANMGHRYQVHEFARHYEGRSFKYIVQCAGHVVAVDNNGCYLDSWDSGEKSIYKAYGIPCYEMVVDHIKKCFPKLCKGLSLERHKQRFTL